MTTQRAQRLSRIRWESACWITWITQQRATIYGSNADLYNCRYGDDVEMSTKHLMNLIDRDISSRWARRVILVQVLRPLP